MNRELSIGRAENNDIILADNSVSRQHASLIISGSTFSIRDNGSSNGTYINGLRVNGMAQLNNDDIVKVGNALVPWMNYVNMTGQKHQNQAVANQPQAQAQPVPQQASIQDGNLSVPNAGGALTCGIIGVLLSFWGIIGVLGLVLCIIAVALGSSGASAFKRNPSKYRRGSLSSANAGKVLGIIGICLFSVNIVLIIAILA